MANLHTCKPVQMKNSYKNTDVLKRSTICDTLLNIKLTIKILLLNCMNAPLKLNICVEIFVWILFSQISQVDIKIHWEKKKKKKTPFT